MTTNDAALEQQIGHWREYLRRHQSMHSTDIAELEDHLRARVAELSAAGLSSDEAFLVAIKRLGSLDELSREFAREHSERLWKQLVVAPAPDSERDERARTEVKVVVSLAVGAAILFKLPELFGYHLFTGNPATEAFYARNLGLFVLPLLAGYFVWKRRSGSTGLWLVAGSFVAALTLANAYPFGAQAHTLGLTVLHLPIALWLTIGVAYVGGRWRQGSGSMDFVRFSGELFIYYTLIALGGGVLSLFTALMFRAIGLDPGRFVFHWLLPCGAMGAVLIAAWLVEAKQSVIENMAPVLARIFAPLFSAVLLGFLGTMAWTGRGINVERDALIGFDLLLAVVLGLVLYAISARDPEQPANAFDALHLVLIVCALVVDAFALVAIAARISALGWSPNKVAALGENVVLLVSLAGSAWQYARFLRGKTPFGTLERWQIGYLPVYSAWAWLVVVVFPPLFGFR